MSNVVLRSLNGEPLSHQQMDSNFMECDHRLWTRYFDMEFVTFTYENVLADGGVIELPLNEGYYLAELYVGNSTENGKMYVKHLYKMGDPSQVLESLVIGWNDVIQYPLFSDTSIVFQGAVDVSLSVVLNLWYKPKLV